MVQQKFVNKGSADLGMKGLKRRLAQGFTLIELMVVVVIIGVLAAVILPNVIGRDDDARAAVAKTDVNNIMQGLKLYKLDNQNYPTAEQGLQALAIRPSTGPAAPPAVVLHALKPWLMHLGWQTSPPRWQSQ